LLHCDSASRSAPDGRGYNTDQSASAIAIAAGPSKTLSRSTLPTRELHNLKNSSGLQLDAPRGLFATSERQINSYPLV